ncbi:MAG TPA: elongation factor P [Phycisphaerae bacterium]|nr:elongation factor P [Phycisphaerae bacterium]
MIKATDIRKGQTIIYENQLWIVHESERVAKGNWRSYMNVKLKNFKSGSVLDFRFNMDDRIEVPYVEDRPFEYLYRDGDSFVLMNTDNFDQLHVPKDLMPDAENFLKGNEKVQCKILNGEIVGVELPNTVELEVVDAPPVVKGATATNQTKEVVLETGYKLRAPPFITTGEKIRVDTRTGEYMSRV